MKKDELLLRCDCSSDHFVAATIWPDDGEGFLELAGCWCDSRWSQRLTRAWQALRGSRVHEASVLLDKAAASQLQDFLKANIPTLYDRRKD